MATFGTQLRHAREAAGLSQTEASQRYGVAGSHWSAWESDTRTPAPERQSAILASLSIPLPEVSADYQRGALWALGAMHETLGRLYRELAATPPVITPASSATGPQAAESAVRAVRAVQRATQPKPESAAPKAKGSARRAR